MSSRADDLKIAQADLVTINNHVAKALLGRGTFNRPHDEAESAVMLLERTARRLRRAFNREPISECPW